MGFATSASYVGEVALFPLAGWSMDRFGRRPTGCASLSVMASGLLTLGLGPPAWSTILVAGALMGCGNALSSGLLMALGSDIAPRHSAGQFVGAVAFIANCGGALGPLAVGAIAQGAGLRAACLSAAAFGVLGVAFWGLLLPETGGRPFLEKKEREKRLLEQQQQA